MAEVLRKSRQDLQLKNSSLPSLTKKRGFPVGTV